MEKKKRVVSQTDSDFKSEVLMQTKCYEITSKSLQALCPNIIYSNSHDLKFFRDLNFIVDEISENNVVMEEVKVSVIIMELLDDFESMNNYELDNYGDTKENIETKVRFHNMARYAVIEYALMTGCIHRDLGVRNILISPEYTGYYVGDSEPSLVGRPAIIDFGYAEFIPNLKEEIISILENESSTKFTDALDKIGTIELSINKYNTMRYASNYRFLEFSGFGWIFNRKFFKTENESDNLKTKIKKTNEMLSMIHAQREIAKRNPIAIERTTYNIPIDNEEQFVNNLFPMQEEKSTNVPMRRLDFPKKIEDNIDGPIDYSYEDRFFERDEWNNDSEISSPSNSESKDSGHSPSLELIKPGSVNSGLTTRDNSPDSHVSEIQSSYKDYPGKSDPGKSDPGKSDPGKSDPGKSDPGKSDPYKGDPGKSDPGKSDPYKSDPYKSDPYKGDEKNSNAYNTAFSDYYDLSKKRGGTIKKYRKYRQKKRSLKKKKNFMTIKKKDRKRKTHRRK